MDSKPSVDVIVRTKNRPLFLRRALRSILSQTWKRAVVFIVNDGGTAGAVEDVVSSLVVPDQRRIHVINNDRSTGRAEALNIGVGLGNSRFVAIHDDDDSWNPHFLAAMIFNFEIAIKRVPNVGGIVSQLRRRFEAIQDDKILPVRTVDVVNGRESVGLLHLERYLRFEEDVFPIQLLMTRDAMAETGQFNPSFEVAEDREFISRLLMKHEISIHRRPLAFHHVRVDLDETDMSNAVQDFDRMVTFLHVWENNHQRRKMNNPILTVRGYLD